MRVKAMKQDQRSIGARTADLIGRLDRRLIASSVAAAVIIGGGCVAAIPASAATKPPAASVQLSRTDGHTVKFSHAVQAEMRKLETTARGRAELLKALEAGFGKVASVSIQKTISNSDRIRADLNCLPGMSCGLSSSGGWHFWIITSYATALSGDLALLVPYCSAALVPVTGPIGAGVCLAVAGIIWELVNNWPRYTNHGVWLAVYWWGIQDGRY